MLPSIQADKVRVSNVGSPPCSERIRLSQAIDQAAKDVKVAEAGQFRARAEQQDIEPYTTALAEMRKHARRLVAALGLHQEEHGC